MRNRTKSWVTSCFVAMALTVPSCKQSSDASSVGSSAPKPKEAASQLQQAFASAPPEVKNNAAAASEALRSSDYTKAVETLHAINVRQNLTLEQGMAVHNSMVALEARLIGAMGSGDENARRAYELLKKLRRS